ncbi:MAG: hypothetical protein KA715_10220 [Xanthomonadaceae bacterium]|nr:hypothetical protein [Xanthomonadaceae bacterium]
MKLLKIKFVAGLLTFSVLLNTLVLSDSFAGRWADRRAAKKEYREKDYSKRDARREARLDRKIARAKPDSKRSSNLTLRKSKIAGKHETPSGE